MRLLLSKAVINFFPLMIQAFSENGSLFFHKKNCLAVRQFSNILFALILPHMLNRPPVVVVSAAVVVSL